MPLPDAIDSPGRIRPCAVAGRFYPSDPDVLTRDIERYLAAANPGSTETGELRAIIAPHAGYVYSAPVAAWAYRYVMLAGQRFRRVVLIGPAHYVAFSGLGCSSASAFATPMGNVRVDAEAVQQLLRHDFVGIQDEAHAPEHGLEVHLPLLIHALSGSPDSHGTADNTFPIVPLLFSDVSYRSAAAALEAFMDEPDTLIVVSSDLSHYHNYDAAKRIDRTTADAIVSGRIDAVTPDRACGHTAIRAVLACAGKREMKVTELDLRNSGDTAGPRDRVVGYGAFVIHR